MSVVTVADTVYQRPAPLAAIDPTSIRYGLLPTLKFPWPCSYASQTPWSTPSSDSHGVSPSPSEGWNPDKRLHLTRRLTTSSDKPVAHFRGDLDADFLFLIDDRVSSGYLQ